MEQPQFLWHPLLNLQRSRVMTAVLPLSRCPGRITVLQSVLSEPCHCRTCRAPSAASRSAASQFHLCLLHCSWRAVQKARGWQESQRNLFLSPTSDNSSPFLWFTVCPYKNRMPGDFHCTKGYLTRVIYGHYLNLQSCAERIHKGGTLKSEQTNQSEYICWGKRHWKKIIVEDSGFSSGSDFFFLLC